MRGIRNPQELGLHTGLFQAGNGRFGGRARSADDKVLRSVERGDGKRSTAALDLGRNDLVRRKYGDHRSAVRKLVRQPSTLSDEADRFLKRQHPGYVRCCIFTET